MKKWRRPDDVRTRVRGSGRRRRKRRKRKNRRKRTRKRRVNKMKRMSRRNIWKRPKGQLGELGNDLKRFTQICKWKSL